MDQKYKATKLERVFKIIDDIDDLNKDDEQDPMKLLERVDSLSRKIEEQKLTGHFKFFLTYIMMKRGFTTGAMSENEYQTLKR